MQSNCTDTERELQKLSDALAELSGSVLPKRVAGLGLFAGVRLIAAPYPLGDAQTCGLTLTSSVSGNDKVRVDISGTATEIPAAFLGEN